MADNFIDHIKHEQFLLATVRPKNTHIYTLSKLDRKFVEQRIKCIFVEFFLIM